MIQFLESVKELGVQVFAYLDDWLVVKTYDASILKIHSGSAEYFGQGSFL